MAKARKQKSRKRGKQHRPRLSGGAVSTDEVLETLDPVSSSDLISRFGLFAAVLFCVVLYAFWPTLIWVEDAWRTEPDYSHGYLVPLLAILLCWHRRDLFPGVRQRPSWAGLLLIALAVLMRVVGRFVYADFLDAWALLPLLAGSVWVLMGPKAMRWALPAIGFLFLMFPLPYQAESMLSYRLQGIATQVSTVFLRVFGQPAVHEGHVIWLGDQKLMVEQACSGMRIFIGVAALAFFWAAMVKRSWVDRLIIIGSVIPLAIFVNAARITVVGALYQIWRDPAYQAPIHDWSGYLMIPLAFALLWLIKTYWEHLYRPLEQMTAKDFVHRAT